MPQLTLRLALPLLTAFMLTLASPASAATDSTQEAKRQFKLAQKAYSSQDYTGALSAFEKAYALRPLPGFLFNMAQCHTKMNQPEKAHGLYQKYVEQHPKAKNREMVETLMAEAKQKMEAAEAKIAKAAAAKAPPPPPPAPKTVPKVAKKPAKKIAAAPAKAAPKVAKKAVVAKKESTPSLSPKTPVAKADDAMALELVPIVPKIIAAKPAPEKIANATTPDLPLVNIAEITNTPAIYKRWWFWSVAGSVVAASVGAILYANHSPEDVVVLPSGTLGRVDQR